MSPSMPASQREPLAVAAEPAGAVGGGAGACGAGRRSARILALMAMVVLFGVSFTIAGNIRAKVLGRFSGVITTILNSFAYAIVYCSVLAHRRRRGLVAREQVEWTFRWKDREGSGPFWSRAGGWRFMFLGGLCDCVTQVLEFTSQAYVNLVAQVILHQMNVVYMALWSMLLLRSRYTAVEVAGIVLSAIGGAIVLASSDVSGKGGNSPLYLALCALAGLPPGMVLKELMFRRYDADKRAWCSTEGPASIAQGPESPLPPRPPPLDVWCVSSTAALFQLLWVVPVALAAAEAERSEGESVGAFLSGAWRCFCNAEGSGCHGAWQSYSLYIGFDVVANVCIYILMREASAVLAYITLKVNLPLTAVLGLLPWPVVGATRLNPADVASLALVGAGAMVFFYGSLLKESIAGRARRVCCFPLFERRSGAPLADS